VGSLLIALALLLGNAFFVGGEFALIASRRTVVEPMAAGSSRARMALRAMEQLPLMIAGSQLGVTICSLGLGAIAEPALAHHLVPLLHLMELPERAAHPAAFVLALGVVVFCHTVIGEMVPKNLTLAGPERAVLWLGPPMFGFCLAFKPLLVAMKWASRQVLRIWRIEATDTVKTVFTAEELAGLVAESRTEGLLDPEEHARITGALALHERTAAAAMRPWASVTTVVEGVTPADLEARAISSGLSRFPVVAADTGKVRGFLHVKDVLGSSGEVRRQPIPARLIRPLPSVPTHCNLAETLLTMRRERRHMVLVGGGDIPQGMLTLDDVLRAVVGGDQQTRSVAV
jgi:CBS domain containing-hemolysin-like protein